MFSTKVKVFISVCLGIFMSGSILAATESGTKIKNQAGATYLDSSGTSRETLSNMVETIIQPVAGVDLEQSQTRPSIPGGVFHFSTP
ncbi:hypothetical protein [Shewanella marina]|uniref:hypothetical protein n=1 Tax=Shewanella marina TaxID=487319 RepID=UPI00046F7481|nr:hypothetical protein [Shewanella marina]